MSAEVDKANAAHQHAIYSNKMAQTHNKELDSLLNSF
jgi:hypothetical protein